MLPLLRKLLPAPLLEWARRPYHWLWALASAAWFGFPSKKLAVIAVTGTKGKSTTTEFINAIFEEAGFTTALTNTIRFKIAKSSERNLFKMTMPGRQFLQRFLREAVDAGCTHAIIEMSSEGAKQFRHKFIALDALVFTNLAPEHIEAHGSYERYMKAKRAIVRALEQSPKSNRVLVTNRDDEFGRTLLTSSVPTRLTYSLAEVEPWKADDSHAAFTFRGTTIISKLPGEFSIYNLLAAAVLAEKFGIGIPTIKRALERVHLVPGRAERIEEGQDFAVIVDYAHTPDSLEALYKAFSGRRIIAVLGATGGGRDTWKRPRMGELAAHYASFCILTNEDPYDEDPLHIIEGLEEGFTRDGAIPKRDYEIIVDRREAIRRALALAEAGDAVLITGKGTDPFIMGPRGEKLPWSDANIAREELLEMRGKPKEVAAFA